MLKIILNRNLLLAAGFKVDKFNTKDYKTMCSLIKQKYPIFNEAIQLHKDIKLIDENGKLVGRYSASQARKKAITMKKDIILVNSQTNPAICKVYNFRESILKKFIDQIVNKRNQSLIRKASSSRQLKISTNLSENQLQIKSKQVIQLAKKNLNVRVYAICKDNQKQQGLSKFDHLKSLVQNKCIVEKDIRVEQYVEKQQDDYDTKKKENAQHKNSISIVFKSKDNEFMDLLTQSSQKDPDHAVEIFLKRYYKQEDVDMRDLKATQTRMQDEMNKVMEELFDSKQSSAMSKILEGKTDKAAQLSQKALQKQRETLMQVNSYIQKQAKARILNSRLKRILEIAQ